MKLRTKATLFLGIFFLTIILASTVFTEYVVGDTFRKQIISDFFVRAGQSKDTYYAFMKEVKIRAVDWTSDVHIQNTVKGVLGARAGTPERARFAKEFATYVSERKMPYDKNIFLVDLLDKDGIVVASTRPDRIGTDELEEEVRLKAHHFSKAIVSESSEVLVRGFVFEEDESSEPMNHAVVRLFTLGKDGVFQPLDAVLLFHFANTREIARAFDDVRAQAETAGSVTNRASKQELLGNYKTSDIYLVNSDSMMVTPSRHMKDVNLHQKVDTLPVRECLEKEEEISGEYDDYNGNRVFGASRCLKDDGLVLMVEAQKDELFASLYSLIRTMFAGGFALSVFLIFVAIFFIRKPFAHIGDVVVVAKRVAEGSLDAQVTVRSKDEIGYLGTSFNRMIASIRDARKALEASKREVEEKAEMLEKDVLEHEKQQKFLEESKKATLNLLEDSWKAGEKLQIEQSRLQTVLSSIGEALVLIDREYKITLVNPRAFKIFGMSLQEVVGKDLRDVMKLWNGKKKEIIPAEWPTEEMFLTKSVVTTTLEDGISLTTAGRENQVPIVLSVAPLGGGLSGGVIVIRDVTADRELDDAKSGFISVASHQLRTPLTSIRWYSEMLLSGDVGPLNDAQKDFMNEIHGGAERLYQTVDLLLGISRVESGKLKMNRTPIDVGVFTGEITKELASQMEMKNLALSVIPPDREPVIVWLDSLTLRQVILNLISNAIRYTNEHGLVEIKWWMGDEGREVVYMVHDNGIGIPEKERSHIFSKFFRAENARSQVPDGSGLGLALVKELVESWGGKIWFDTNEGQGATFFFTIPLTTKVQS